MSTKKKIIIFGCSITPLLVIIGTIIYSSSSKNNVRQDHQNNVQFEEEKKEENKKEEKINIQAEEEYIPCLDNYKIQMGLWFITDFIFFSFFIHSPKDVFKNNYQVFWFSFKLYFVKKISENKKKFLKEFIIIIIITLLISEFILSFIYLLACWTNKPLKKAFSINHRFWGKSWTNLFLTFIIKVVFYWINQFLVVAIKYFIGSFYFDKTQKEEISEKNLALKDQCILFELK